MKSAIVSAIESIAGDRLTPELRDEIATEAIRIIGEANRAIALSAIETVKQTIAAQSESDKS